MKKFRLAPLVILILSAMVTLACTGPTTDATQSPTTVSPAPTVVPVPTDTPNDPTATPAEPAATPVDPTATPVEPTSVPPTGPATPEGLSQEELDQLQSDLSANIEKWQISAPLDYSMEFSVTCFCPTTVTAPVTIVVRDPDTIESINYVETGEPVAENPDVYLTVGGIFDRIQEAIDMRVASLTVSYDPDLGYPTDVYIDRDFMMADEERGFTVSSLMPIPALTLDEIQSRLDSNRELWESSGRSDYRIEYRRNCFCPTDLTSPVVVAVVEGSIESVTYAETGEPVREDARDLFPDVAGLFDILQDAVDRDAASIRASYDAQLGYPVSIAIDYETMMADEELGFSVISLE
jgi:hypothetical protein